MRMLASADATVQVIEDEWYRISTSDIVPDAPDRTMRSYGTLGLFEGDVFVDTGTTARDVAITVEEWSTEPPLRIADSGGFAEVVETSVPFEATRLRVLEANGSEALALDLNGGISTYRLRLYSRYLDVRRIQHLLRLWPAPTDKVWIYQLDEDGQPAQRPDRSATDTLGVTMTAGQANTIGLEAEVMAVLEVQDGDIDDIVEDCLQIRDLIPDRADPAPRVTVALTVRQWKVALAVLDHRSTSFVEPDRAEAMADVRDLIEAQIGDRLPPGRVYGV